MMRPQYLLLEAVTASFNRLRRPIGQDTTEPGGIDLATRARQKPVRQAQRVLSMNMLPEA